MDTNFITPPAVFSPTDDELMNYQYTSALLSCEESMAAYDSDANYLKKRQYMKSPVIIYNHCHVKGVLKSSYWLRRNLELHARKLKSKTGFYIRPLVLFVLKSDTLDEVDVLKNIKKELIEGGIEEAEIKIKTNSIDELKYINLMDEACDVRYIITVLHLREKWRCPFAYVIASLEERAISSDLTTVLDCLLPMPGEIKTTDKELNTAYIITASSRFEKTVIKISDHLHDLGAEPEEIIVLNKMTELMKNMSIWDVLTKENSEIKGVKFKEGVLSLYSNKIKDSN